MPGGLHPPKNVTDTWKPNHVDPQTRGWGLPASLIALYWVAFFAVGFRLLGRLVYMRNAGIDDIFIVISLVGDPLCHLCAKSNSCIGFSDGIHRYYGSL
jgi:hypothetical protein